MLPPGVIHAAGPRGAHALARETVLRGALAARSPAAEAARRAARAPDPRDGPPQRARHGSFGERTRAGRSGSAEPLRLDHCRPNARRSPSRARCAVVDGWSHRVHRCRHEPRGPTNRGRGPVRAPGRGQPRTAGARIPRAAPSAAARRYLAVEAHRRARGLGGTSCRPGLLVSSTWRSQPVRIRRIHRCGSPEAGRQSPLHPPRSVSSGRGG